MYQSTASPCQTDISENKSSQKKMLDAIEAGTAPASLEAWAALLAKEMPRQYGEPPQPTDVIITRDKEKRIALMAARAERKEAIRGKDDANKLTLDRLATPLRRNRNGSDNAGHGAARPESEVRGAAS